MPIQVRGVLLHTVSGTELSRVIRYPNPQKAIFHQEPEQQPCVFAVGLLLLDSLGFDLGGISDPHLEP